MTTPHFARPPSLMIVASIAVSAPSLYFAVSGLIPVWATTLMQLVFFFAPAMVVLQHWGAHGLLNRERCARRFAVVAILSALIAVTLNEALPFWDRLIPLPREYADGFTRLLHPGSLRGKAWDVFALALIPAVSEEVFFRGFLQTALMSRMRAGTAVIATAALFAIYHLVPWYAPFYFLLGIFFGAILVRTGNLALAVTAHCVNNMVGLVYGYQGW